MCGRFAIFSSIQAIKEYYKILQEIEGLEENYNACPQQNLPVVIRCNDQNRIRFMKWGLVPFWIKNVKTGSRMINARAETLQQKPSFRNAFARRRCLIPANGYYEWHSNTKQPFFIYCSKRSLFSFAGIWEFWKSDEMEIHSFAIITREASPDLKFIHHRMPVVLPKEAEKFWLMENDGNKVNMYLQKLEPINMMFHKVSREVNSVQNNFPELIEQDSFLF